MPASYRQRIIDELGLSPSEIEKLADDEYSYQLLLEVLGKSPWPNAPAVEPRATLADGRILVSMLVESGPAAAAAALHYDLAAKNGPFLAFDSEGQIDIPMLSSVLTIPPETLEQGLKTRAGSGVKASSRAVELLGAMNELAYAMIDPHNVVSWLRTPQPTLQGLSPIDRMNRGQLEYVLQVVHDYVFMTPD